MVLWQQRARKLAPLQPRFYPVMQMQVHTPRGTHTAPGMLGACCLEDLEQLLQPDDKLPVIFAHLVLEVGLESVNRVTRELRGSSRASAQSVSGYGMREHR